jgi:hypothetical protein
MICLSSSVFYIHGKPSEFSATHRHEGIQSITKDARVCMGNEGTALVTAGALITGSPLNRMLGRYFFIPQQTARTHKIVYQRTESTRMAETLPVT